MTAVQPYFDDIDREIIWLLKLYLPRCTLENGVGACAAANPCAYTYTTCKDLTNYTQGERVFQFCSTMAHLPGCLSMIDTKGMKLLSTAINSDKFKTERGEMRISMADGGPGVLVDPAKTTSPDEGPGEGQYWARFLARQVWQGSTAKLYYGFYGMALADYELFFTGVIDDIDYGKRGAVIKIYDRLYKLADIKVPGETPTSVALEVAYNGAATMDISTISDFKAASVKEPRQVKLEDEIVEYTGTALGPPQQLTGCTPGMYGTAAVLHAIGTEVAQCQVYSGDAGYTAGLEADRIFMDLLVNWAGVPSDAIGFTDIGATLLGPINNVVTTIQLAITGQPSGESGVGFIEDEIITWSRYNAPRDALEDVIRGMYGTAAAGHAGGVDMTPTMFTEQINKYIPGNRYKLKLDDPTSIKNLIEYIQPCTLMDVYQDEDGYVKGKMQAPPWYDEIPPTLLPKDMKLKSRKFKMKDSNRATRVLGYYNPVGASPGKNASDYQSLFGYVGAEEESAKWYGQAQVKTLFLPFTFRDIEAGSVTNKYFARYRQGVPEISFIVELVRMPIKVAALVVLLVPELVDEAGAPRIRLFRVIKKEFMPPNKIKLILEDTGFGTKRYPAIGYDNGVLNAPLPALQNFMDIDISGNGPPLERWRSHGAVRVIGTHLHGVYGGGTFEDILYSGVTDLGGGVVKLLSLQRGQNGTAPALWAGGLMAAMQYCAASDIEQANHGFQGNAAGNWVDSDEDYVSDTDGYYIY